MAPRSKIFHLPEDMRAKLDERIRADRYGNIVAITEWLNFLGHDVGKSAVGLHAKALRKADGVSLRPTPEPDKELAALRLNCLDLAQRLNPDRRIDFLKNEANELLAWAMLAPDD